MDEDIPGLVSPETKRESQRDECRFSKVRAPGIAAGSKKLLGAPGRTTSSKKLLVRSCDVFRPGTPAGRLRANCLGGREPTPARGEAGDPEFPWRGGCSYQSLNHLD